jgi:lipoate-protein ligase A
MTQEELATDQDFEYARDNMKRIIKTGFESLDNLAQLAREGESPRVYEVLTELMKTLSDVSKDVLDLREKKKKIKETTPKKEASSTTTVTGENIFIGTPSQLLKAAKAAKANIINDDNVIEGVVESD